MSAKIYLKYFLLIILVVIIPFHTITWLTNTQYIFDNKKNIYVGDLGRLSYSRSSLYPRETKTTLEKKHRNYIDYKPTDVITIGDSFSHGRARGNNPYYQDFIATKYNLDVLNIAPSNLGYIETVLMLNNSGELDKLQPKAIILESVERKAIERFSNKINWDIQAKQGDLFVKKNINIDVPKVSMINNNNYKSWLYRILYNFYDNALFSKVYKVDLEEDFFICDDASMLLFYYSDLDGITKANKSNIIKLNNNLNKLNSILKNKGIKLYFMPAVDKYNVYSKYVTNKKYKKSVFFELLRTMPKDYMLIDTKLILRKLTDQKVLNVFYPDDTHWSGKASNEITNKLNFKL